MYTPFNLWFYLLSCVLNTRGNTSLRALSIIVLIRKINNKNIQFREHNIYIYIVNKVVVTEKRNAFVSFFQFALIVGKKKSLQRHKYNRGKIDNIFLVTARYPIALSKYFNLFLFNIATYAHQTRLSYLYRAGLMINNYVFVDLRVNE